LLLVRDGQVHLEHGGIVGTQVGAGVNEENAIHGILESIDDGDVFLGFLAVLGREIRVILRNGRNKVEAQESQGQSPKLLLEHFVLKLERTF
jgi:hypothetical protein